MIPKSKFQSSFNELLNVYKYSDGIAFDLGIPTHITEYDGFTQIKGVGGTHNMDEFMAAVDKNNIKIISQKEGGVDGVYVVKYKIPSVDSAGKVVLDANGGVVYKNSEFTKTVYDPRVISNSTILDLGQQAASVGYVDALSNGLKAYNAEAGGISFRVYVDPDSGLIKNFHPR